MKLSKVRKNLILSEVETWDSDQKRHFHEMVAHGVSLSMAHQLASRQAAIPRTDTAFMAMQTRSKNLVQDLPPWLQKELGAAAKARGYVMKGTDAYHPGVADGIGDPDAFVNQGEAMSKFKTVAQKRGVEMGGAMEIAGPADLAPVKRKHKLHPRIVERIRHQKIAEDPGLVTKDQAELRYDIVQNHSPKPNQGEV